MHDSKEARAKRAANLAKLPPLCFAQLGVSRAIVLLKRGETGYFPLGAAMARHQRRFPETTAADINARLGVTPAQAEAMFIGAMFGWHVDGADPDSWSPRYLETLARVRAKGRDRAVAA